MQLFDGPIPISKANPRPKRIPFHPEPREKKGKPNPRRQPIAAQAETEFRHLHWQRQRTMIRDYLFTTGLGRAALDSWDNCGAECTVEWSDELQRHRLRGSYCHNRHCQPCARARASLIANNLRDKISNGPADPNDRYRFITLTLRHTTDDLQSRIKEIQRCFTRLRQTPLWRRSQRGGVAMLEVKKGQSGLWHPHLHVISEGTWVKQEKLSKAWDEISHGSFRVDIKIMDSARDAVHYVSKYVTKGVPDDVWNDPDAAKEWIIASRGLRTAATYGTWRGFRLLHHDPKNAAKDWKAIATLTTMIREAAAGATWAIELWAKLEDALVYDPHKKRHKIHKTTQ